MSYKLTSSYDKTDLESLKDLNKDEETIKIYMSWNIKEVIYSLIEWCKQIDTRLDKIEANIDAIKTK